MNTATYLRLRRFIRKHRSQKPYKAPEKSKMIPGTLEGEKVAHRATTAK